MYDGWSKVKLPIAKSQVDAKRVDAPTKKKRSKGKAVAVTDDEMDTDSESGGSTTNSNSATEWPNFVHGYDVVITTYPILRSDLYVAHPGPKRPRRTKVVYERPRSPLVMVEWKRVVMDEVQMVGGGKAA